MFLLKNGQVKLQRNLLTLQSSQPLLCIFHFNYLRIGVLQAFEELLLYRDKAFELLEPVGDDVELGRGRR